MPDISFDDSNVLGYLEEGTLRKQGDTWFLECPGGRKVPIGDILGAYLNKEIRLSVMDLKEAEYYHTAILQNDARHDDESNGSGDGR